MPRELRFCRNCGFRLGEGSAEYTETVRFAEPQQAALLGRRPNVAGQPVPTTYGHSGGMAPTPPTGLKRRRKISGMTWMFMGLLMFFVLAAGFTAIITPIRRTNIVINTPAVTRSFVGVDGFDSIDGGGGATFQNVEPPGGPADKAGLIGGDIIVEFDGRKIEEEDQIRELLDQIPVGNTVDVVYLRDGERHTTKLTTVSSEESNRLKDEFKNRPEGRGLFGFDEGETRRVPIEGTNIFGVRLDEITPNRPADLAGVKDGDIVIEFNGVPIRTRQELSARVRRAIPYSTVDVVVRRGGETIKIPVKMGKG